MAVNVKNTTFEKEPFVSDLEAIIEEKKPLKTTTESVVIDDNDADSKKIDSVFSDSVEKEPKDGIDSNSEAKPFKTTMESVEIDTESKNVSKIDFSDFETKNEPLNLNVLDNVVIDSELSDLKTKNVSQIEVDIRNIFKENENKTLAKISDLLEKSEIKKVLIKKENDTVRPLDSKIEAKKGKVEAARPKNESQVKPNATLKKTTLKVDIGGPKIVKVNPKIESDKSTDKNRVQPKSTSSEHPKIDQSDQLIKENHSNSTSSDHKIEKSYPKIDLEDKMKSAINESNNKESNLNNSYDQNPNDGYMMLPNSTVSEYKNITILEPTKFEKKDNKIAINYVYIFTMIASAIFIPIIIGAMLFFCCKRVKKPEQNIELGEFGKGNEEKAENSDNTNTSEL